jgi:hypothetical protein
VNVHCDSEEVHERHIIENIYCVYQYKMHLRQKHLDSSQQSDYEDVLCTLKQASSRRGNTCQTVSRGHRV